MGRARLGRARLERRLRAAVLASGLIVTAGSAVSEDAAFVSEIRDLPLMPGLIELSDAGLAFDKPDGRIVEAYARGSVEREVASAFYRRTLPQLGWRIAGSDRFEREGERLQLEFLEQPGALVLRFVLLPD